MAGLLGLGQAYKQQNRELWSNLADREERRNRVNDEIKQQKQASTLSLAGTGAMMGGQIGGPWGAVIGGAVGLLGGLATNGDLF